MTVKILNAAAENDFFNSNFAYIYCMKRKHLLLLISILLLGGTSIQAQKSVPNLIIEAYNDASSGFISFNDYIVTNNGMRQLSASKIAEYSGAEKVYLYTYTNKTLSAFPGKKFTEYEMSVHGYKIVTPYKTWAEARDSVYDKFYTYYAYFETLLGKQMSHSKILGQKIGTDDSGAPRYKVFFYPKGMPVPDTDDGIEILRALGNTTYFTLEIWDVPLLKGKYYLAINIIGFKEQP